MRVLCSTMDVPLEVLSLGIAISLVSLAFILLQRGHGIVLLEIVPAGVASSILAFSLLGGPSTATVSPITLLAPLAAVLAVLNLLSKCYRRWRLRVAGEPTVLMISFAFMNCILLLMANTTGGRSVVVSLSESCLFASKRALELCVSTIAFAVAIVVSLQLRGAGFLAAIQLAKDDSSFLSTFDFSAGKVRLYVLVLATALCFVGCALVVGLQENFSVAQADTILISAFGVAIFQSRIRIATLIPTALLLISAEHVLTSWTSETLQRCHQGALFAGVVVTSIILRILRDRGTSDWLRRRFQRAHKRESECW